MWPEGWGVNDESTGSWEEKRTEKRVERPSSAMSAIANTRSAVAKEGLHAEIFFQDISNGTTESDRSRRQIAIADPRYLAGKQQL